MTQLASSGSGSLLSVQATCWPGLQASKDLAEVKSATESLTRGLSMVHLDIRQPASPKCEQSKRQRHGKTGRERQTEPKMEIPVFLKSNLEVNSHILSAAFYSSEASPKVQPTVKWRGQRRGGTTRRQGKGHGGTFQRLPTTPASASYLGVSNFLILRKVGCLYPKHISFW